MVFGFFGEFLGSRILRRTEELPTLEETGGSGTRFLGDVPKSVGFSYPVRVANCSFTGKVKLVKTNDGELVIIITHNSNTVGKLAKVELQMPPMIAEAGVPIAPVNEWTTAFKYRYCMIRGADALEMFCTELKIVAAPDGEDSVKISSVKISSVMYRAGNRVYYDEHLLDAEGLELLKIKDAPDGVSPIIWNAASVGGCIFQITQKVPTGKACVLRVTNKVEGDEMNSKQD